MRTLLLATAAATLVAAAAPAFAQDTDKAPFTGARGELLVGYDHLGGGGDHGKDGLSYGGAAGYDVQVGALLLGVEGEVTWSTVKARANDYLVAGDSLRVAAGRDAYVGGRIGMVVMPATLLYAKGGYSNARANISYTQPIGRRIDHEDLDGFRIGAGVEHQLTRNAYVKAEYRYSQYGGSKNYDVDLDRHQVLGGVGLRF